MKELIESFLKHMSSRAKSQLYGVFGFWWFIVHWSYFYSVIFLDQDLIFKKTGMLKDQYLHTTYFNWTAPTFWVKCALPFLLAYLTIWQLPRLSKLAYKKEKDSDYERYEIKNDYNKKIEKHKTKLEEKKVEQLDIAVKRVEKEAAIENIESAKWDETYRDFRKSEKLFKDFHFLVDAIYNHSGSIRADYNEYSDRYMFELPNDVLVFAHTNDLVIFDKSSNSVELTDKGKYFIRRYSIDKN